MIEIGVEEFVRRLERMLTNDNLIAVFLGAGASISSGIPGASALTTRWVRELHETECAGTETFDEWRGRCLPDYDETQPAKAYATVMKRLFPFQADRQEEIERIVAGHDPGFAYATLAQLMAHPKLGPRCNIVLTTNFDDLLADALYLYTRLRPLVVTHEALVDYAAVGRRRPTIIKLHGDAMLQPRNTEDEVAELHPAFVEALSEHLRSRALVVVGHGGNDQGVFRALERLPRNVISHGIYWISDHIPDNDLGEWLRRHHESVHVRHLGFDELMAIVKTRFKLRNPDARRFSNLMDGYVETFAKLQVQVRSENRPQSLVARSVEEVSKQFDDWTSALLEARRWRVTDPDRAEGIYEQGIAAFPDAVALVGDYASFLQEVRHANDRALLMFERALAGDPEDTTTLNNFAAFLVITRQYNRAQEFYEKAIAIRPSPVLLANYASFLLSVREDVPGAEAIHRRNISAFPDSASALSNFALFLHQARKDERGAANYFERALTADPSGFDLSRYAGFLYARGELDKADEVLGRARATEQYRAFDHLLLETNFYELANANLSDADRGERLRELARTLKAGSRVPWRDFRSQLAAAAKRGRSKPQMDFLETLARVINERADLDQLEPFSEWPR